MPILYYIVSGIMLVGGLTLLTQSLPGDGNIDWFAMLLGASGVVGSMILVALGRIVELLERLLQRGKEAEVTEEER